MHSLNKRRDGAFEIIKQQSQYSSGLIGDNNPSANRQTNSEASQMLYGQNQLVFNTARSYSYSGIPTQGFDSNQHLYPGFPIKNEAIPAMSDNRRTINKLLGKNSFQTRFSWHDPLLLFFHIIGHHNSSHLRSITMNDFFRSFGVRNNVPFAEYFRKDNSYENLANLHSGTQWGVC